MVIHHGHFKAGVGWLAALAAGSIAVQLTLGSISATGLLAAALSVASASWAVYASFHEGKILLGRNAWWRILRRGALLGACSLVTGLLILQAAAGALTPTSLGIMLALAMVSNAVMAPAGVFIILARMRKAHLKEFPLDGRTGEIEA